MTICTMPDTGMEDIFTKKYGVGNRHKNKEVELINDSSMMNLINA